MLKTAQSYFIRLDKTPERNGRTEEQISTDRQTDRIALAITAVCFASNAQCGRALKTDVFIYS